MVYELISTIQFIHTNQQNIGTRGSLHTFVIFHYLTYFVKNTKSTHEIYIFQGRQSDSYMFSLKCMQRAFLMFSISTMKSIFLDW